jgi:excinuclease UvrABC nuclease subunit
MGKRLKNRQTFNQTNLQDVPDQSGIYLMRNKKGACQYVGSAGAGRLASRLKEYLQKRDIPGAHTFQIRTVTSEEARKLERQYRGHYRSRCGRNR